MCTSAQRTLLGYIAKAADRLPHPARRTFVTSEQPPALSRVGFLVFFMRGPNERVEGGAGRGVVELFGVPLRTEEAQIDIEGALAHRDLFDNGGDQVGHSVV